MKKKNPWRIFGGKKSHNLLNNESYSPNLKNTATATYLHHSSYDQFDSSQEFVPLCNSAKSCEECRARKKVIKNKTARREILLVESTRKSQLPKYEIYGQIFRSNSGRHRHP